MHGRLKVRTTEEERERKKKEQALKVKAYRAAMIKIREKRSSHELDGEMLQLTSQILLRNPDVSTLWNIRRECVEQNVKNTEIVQEQQAIFETELNFSEQCLLVNPKSYNCWHHRCWILEHSPEPNWEHEVQLCTKYLKMDERNFHTWDYRRFVVEKANIPKQSELDFCTEKIKVNFSNYSSWHHRSLLLPLLYPYEGDAQPKRAMSEKKLQDELEMVLTAAFTDPNDSSAWFYQRWLLGYSRQELDACAFRCNNKHAILAFTNPLILDAEDIAITDKEGNVMIKMTEWYSINKTKADNVWFCSLTDNGIDYKVFPEEAFLVINRSDVSLKKINLKRYKESMLYFKSPNQHHAFSENVLKELQSQLESCESLLEYEPDSKWTLLTSALLMRAIDAQKYHNKSLENLEKLQKVDTLRENYYKDLASKWILEKCLLNWMNSDVSPYELDLRSEKLDVLYYHQYLCIADKVLLPDSLSGYSSMKQLQGFSLCEP